MLFPKLIEIQFYYNNNKFFLNSHYKKEKMNVGGIKVISVDDGVSLTV